MAATFYAMRCEFSSYAYMNHCSFGYSFEHEQADFANMILNDLFHFNVAIIPINDNH